MNIRPLAPILLAAALPGALVAGDPVANSKYAPFTLVAYNQNVEESRKLAAYYAEKRGIPLANLVALDCPAGEVISREDFEAKVQAPLQELFDTNGWWDREEDAAGTLRPTRNKIKFIALMYGMPLKISRRPPQPTGATDPETGEPVLEQATHQNHDGASLDSELMLLGVDLDNLAGPTNNPYFRGAEAFARPEVLLTARIDGPDYATARRLVDDALAAEASGLWGTAAIDIADLAASMGPGYKIGDTWMENCATFYHKAGIPVVVDRSPARFPPGYPLGGDVILYFGWYSGSAEGPFADPGFKFKPGAIACHLHSYSASTLRTKTSWTAALLSRGACAALGNVYEPFLTMSTHFDIFNARLLAGFTLAEAAWMATPATSWMTIVVGDPLYQPFRRDARYGKQPDADFKAYKVAARRWGGAPAELIPNLRRAAESLDSAMLIEAGGLYLLGEKKYDEAMAEFAAAKAAFEAPADKLRQDLHRGRALLAKGDRVAAIQQLRAAAAEFKSTPGEKAAVALANQLDPPPPPPPPGQ